MIWDNPVLDRIVERETFAEILARLTPSETVVAILRADGLDDQEIADALGITRAAVQRRIKNAVARISQQVPGASALLAGRDRFNSASRQLTIPDREDMIPVATAARMLECSGQTIRNWITTGRLPHAERAPAGYWLIPWGDLEGMA